MYDFLNTVRKRAKHAESLFMCSLDAENYNYTKNLLVSSYEVKKYARKFNSKKTFKTDRTKNSLDYINAVSLFSMRLNYVHLIFTSMITVIVTETFNEDIHSYSKLTNHKEFKKVFDSTEQELLIKFNQLRNIIVHTSFAEMFLDFKDDDFKQLQDFIQRMIELEKVIMYELRRNSVFSPHSHKDII